MNVVVFDRLHVDGAGIGEIGIAVCCHRLDGTKYPTKISNCTIATSESIQYGAPVEHYVLRSASTPGATFVRAWNAWRTNVP